MLRKLLLCVGCVIIAGCSAIPSVQEGQSLAEYLDTAELSGSVLVVRDGAIIHNQGYGFADRDRQRANDADTRYLIGSVTKQFTALAMMQLQEKGLLHLDDPVSKYLPDYPDGNEISIRNLLMHSAGLYNFTDDWDRIKYAGLSPDQVIEQFREIPPEFEPGTRVKYSNSGYMLAGKILEAVTGTRYADYMQTHVFQPLGMNNSAYGLTPGKNTAVGYIDDKGVDLKPLTDTHAAGALSASANDMYLWGRSFDEHPLVNPHSLAEIFPTDREGLGIGLGSGRFKVVMGLGWFFYETDYGPEYAHGGHIEGFSSVIARYPEQNGFIIVLSNRDQYDAWTLKDRIARLAFTDERS